MNTTEIINAYINYKLLGKHCSYCRQAPLIDSFRSKNDYDNFVEIRGICHGEQHRCRINEQSLRMASDASGMIAAAIENILKKLEINIIQNDRPISWDKRISVENRYDQAVRCLGLTRYNNNAGTWSSDEIRAASLRSVERPKRRLSTDNMLDDRSAIEAISAMKGKGLLSDGSATSNVFLQYRQDLIAKVEAKNLEPKNLAPEKKPDPVKVFKTPEPRPRIITLEE